MYIPSYGTIARALDCPEEAAELLDDGNIIISKKSLRLLLQYVALSSDYDESFYLRENNDIAEAYEAGKVTDMRKHYREHGFFEGRKAANVDFDEDWYLGTYPDVAASVSEGDFSSGLAHFSSEAKMKCGRQMNTPTPGSRPGRNRSRIRSWKPSDPKPARREI